MLAGVVMMMVMFWIIGFFFQLFGIGVSFLAGEDNKWEVFQWMAILTGIFLGIVYGQTEWEATHSYMEAANGFWVTCGVWVGLSVAFSRFCD